MIAATLDRASLAVTDEKLVISPTYPQITVLESITTGLMEQFSSSTIWGTLAQYALLIAALFVVIKALFAMVRWGKKMPKGAFIFLAFFPLISLFPIPPTVFKNVEKAKQEQPKKKEADGDGPNEP